MSQTRADLRRYLAVLARRWTVIVPAIVLVPLVALLLAARQQKVYAATAQVLLTYSNPGTSLNGLANPYPGIAPERNVATQVALARGSAVAQEALALSHVHSTASGLLAESSVSSPNDSDLLDFSVNDSPPALAVRLATNYAEAYTVYRTQLDSQAITGALAGINGQLAQLTRAGQTGSDTYRTLSHEQQALIATQASGTSDAVLAQPAQNAVQVGPHPARSAAVGLGVGIVLAVALVFLMETFDQRVAVDEIERRLKIPRLASIPATRRWRRELRALVALDEANRRGREAASLVVLDDPNGREARAFRVLTSRLELARLEHDFKSLLFTSAPHYDTQPETVGNLAMTLAQAGQRVLLCDLSARQPAISDLFQLAGRPGVTEVILARMPLEDAVVPINDPSLASAAPGSAGDHSANGEGTPPRVAPSHNVGGSLAVLPFGGPAPHSGFLGTRAVTELMDRLRRAPYDLVLIDAPPLLACGEAQTLSTLADAVIVALPDPVRLRVLDNLSAILSRSPVLALGFVTVGVGSAIARSRSPGGGVSASAPNRDLAPVASIANGHQYRPVAVPRRVETLRKSPRYVYKRRDP
jgi:Mrp family chromosome partitioning ATPase/capsular polysaccharide biosynthesis protein